MNFEIGQIVGGYEIIGTIGAGGMGTVYRVRNPITDRIDAMKVLLPDLCGSPDLASRFLREIKIHASLRHPNIAALYTAMNVDNSLLMVMEFVEGMTLDSRFQYGTLGIGEAMEYSLQILSALAFAHQKGIVHRDIKPSNIMITAEGLVKLLDFGIARGPSDLRITQAGMVVGSLLYMSPEQVMGGNVDERSDLYSTGVTLYRMVTGRTPIEGTNEFAIMRAQTESIPIPACEISAAVEPGLSRVIMKSLEKDPAARYRTANEFRSALEIFRVGTLPSPENAATVPDVSSDPRFPGETLASVERLLAQYAGPIARHMVKKTSREVSTVADLCAALAAQLHSAREREAFEQASAKEFGLTAPPPAATVMQQWNPDALEEIRRSLAAAIGPVAKVLVERKSRKARSLRELRQMLSEEIPSRKDRDAFLSHPFQSGPNQ